MEIWRWCGRWCQVFIDDPFCLGRECGGIFGYELHVALFIKGPWKLCLALLGEPLSRSPAGSAGWRERGFLVMHGQGWGIQRTGDDTVSASRLRDCFHLGKRFSPQPGRVAQRERKPFETIPPAC